MNKLGLKIVVSFHKSFHIKMIPMTNLFGNFLCRWSAIRGYLDRDWVDSGKRFNSRMYHRFGNMI